MDGLPAPADYRENLRFYHGFQWPYQRINQKRRRLVFNYAKTLVEKVTSYLMTGRQIVVIPDDDTPEAQAVLKRVHAGLTAHLDAINRPSATLLQRAFTGAL